MKAIPAALALLFLLPLAACAGLPEPAERRDVAEEIAADGNLTPVAIRTAHFDLLGLMRGSAEGGRLTVYIEGDGLPWKRKNKISDDPTPVNPVAMRLAVVDPSAAVAYLARPCQFTGGTAGRNCTSDVWTKARYGEEAVSAVNEGLQQLKERAGAREIALVGYSGGGTIAALLAMRRTDIVWMKTVASPLDTDAFTSIHKVTPLSASLNPAENAAALARIPQIHYVGEEDKIVPAEINRRFLSRMNDASCAALVILPGLDHRNGWPDIWPDLAGEAPLCR
jgi:pimeloyl-ACP methyl ester carboxylesterase